VIWEVPFWLLMPPQVLVVVTVVAAAQHAAASVQDGVLTVRPLLLALAARWAALHLRHRVPLQPCSLLPI